LVVVKAIAAIRIPGTLGYRRDYITIRYYDVGLSA